MILFTMNKMNLQSILMKKFVRFPKKCAKNSVAYAGQIKSMKFKINKKI